MEQQSNFLPFKSDFIKSFYNSCIAYLSQFKDTAVISEYAIIVLIFLFSHLIQKVIHRHYLQKVVQASESPTLLQKLIYSAISFSQPFIAFVLLLIAMSINSIFTEKLDIYKISIKFSMIWFGIILITHTISDFFVRSVVLCTFVPFLIFTTLGLSHPVINYLDSLGFNLAGIHLSVFLILKTLLIATCLFWIARSISRFVLALIDNQTTINVEIRDLMQNLFQIILYTTVTLITIDIVGIDLKSLAILGGAIGIGIGIGLQKIAANFISGIIILFEQNVKVGHLIEVSGGKPGWIRHLGARAAVIDTGDGKDLLVPNEELLTKTVIDWTTHDRKTRTDLHIKVSFQSDLEKAKEIMIQAVQSHPFCSKRHPPACFLEQFTDNGAEFLLQFWVDDLAVGKMDMQNDVLLYIWKRFAEEKIQHPLPLKAMF